MYKKLGRNDNEISLITVRWKVKTATIKPGPPHIIKILNLSSSFVLNERIFR